MRILWILLIAGIVISMPMAIAQGELATTLHNGPLAMTLYKRALAIDMAKFLHEEHNLQLLREKFADSSERTLDLVPFLKNIASPLHRSVATFDEKVRRYKNIQNRIASVLEIRLAFPEMGLARGDKFLVAYVPGGEEKDWESIEAFDTKGNIHQLDPQTPPQHQVIVVGLNARKDMRAGLALLNERLREAGLQPQSTETTSLEVSKITHIRVDDDGEAWVKGDAEVYAMVNGIAPTTSSASVLAEELPYLDDEDEDYYPNQVLIVWDNYRYNAANINFYEHDDDTNYQEIALGIIDAIGQISTDYQYITQIASQIIQLMPANWWTDDDDYVDVFYTLEKGVTYTDYKGVSNNVKFTLVPYTISGN